MVAGGSQEVSRLLLGGRRFPQYPCNWIGVSCFCGLNELKTKVARVYGVVNVWLWGNLSFENLNLERELGRYNPAFKLYECNKICHSRNYAHPRRNFQSPSCRLNRQNSAAGLAICTNQRHRLPMEPNSCCS